LENNPITDPLILGANSRGERYVHGLGVVDVSSEDGLEIAVGAEVDYVGFTEFIGVVGGEGYGETFSTHGCFFR
jgi:hypothetical protein